MSLSPPAPRLEATNSGEPCTAGEERDQLLAPMPPPVLPREWPDDPWTLTQPLAESGPVTHWGLHMAPTSPCLHNSTTKQEDITKASAAGAASVYMGLRLHCSLGQQPGPQIPTRPPAASQTTGVFAGGPHLWPLPLPRASGILRHSLAAATITTTCCHCSSPSCFQFGFSPQPMHHSIFLSSPPLHHIFVQLSSACHPPTPRHKGRSDLRIFPNKSILYALV